MDLWINLQSQARLLRKLYRTIDSDHETASGFAQNSLRDHISYLNQVLDLYCDDPAHFPLQEGDFVRSFVFGLIASIKPNCCTQKYFPLRVNKTLTQMHIYIKNCQDIVTQLLTIYPQPVHEMGKNERRSVSIYSLLSVLSLRVEAFSWTTIKLGGLTKESKSAFVHYYPLSITEILTTSISSIADHEHGRKVFIKAHDYPDHVALSITNPHQKIFLTQWQTLSDLIQPRYEYLRELGGNIEPLTWDEGYGQGVIVRLPWAKKDL